MKTSNFSRWSGVFIALLVTAGAGLLWWGVSASGPSLMERPAQHLFLGVWNILYATQAPAVSTIFVAIAIALLMAAAVAIVELVVTTRYRRSGDATATPLSPRVVMGETRGVHAGPVTVTALIPAHNEEASLPRTLESLQEQSVAPTRIVVVADNCTDGTVEVARRFGAEVFETRDNRHKKAGGLNQALSEILDDQGDNDVVMVMDADTMLDPGFLAEAVARFTFDRALMAVGGLFQGEEGHGLIGQFQRNEYIRYSRELKRRRGRVFVLTGTASLFRPRGLRAVAEQRGTALPGEPGQVYDTAALTEDNELTIALKSLGALVISPHQCTVVTELMPTWRTLWAQRLRWQRGALENLGAYGIRPQTARYWAQQVGIGYGVIALATYFLLLAVMALALDTWIWFPFWFGLGAVFAVERVMTVWRGGWRARLLALLLVPELCYDMVLNLAYVKGIIDSALGTKAAWKHVQHRSEVSGAIGGKSP
ncbi:MAG TPA: glycosyltransferase family 2 protein [Arthrobacter sp.]|nr:glycosyltransferase family 2 protein [Arthrobacter sp.]